MSDILDFQLRAENFRKRIHLFRLGHLTTETPHPKTRNLRDRLVNDLQGTLKVLAEVEAEAYQKLLPSQGELIQLQNAVLGCWSRGGRVFLCGCGATGRLSLLLETLWRQENPNRADAVQSFMAGGDYALVRSIENFEDFSEYGEKQLLDSGFTRRDLLIGSSEGGETPFVIGAVLGAASLSEIKPFFIFCNTVAALGSIERSQGILSDPRVRNISLSIGPMALSGSTRLQATSCLTFFIGTALLTSHRPDLPKVLPRIVETITQMGDLGFEELVRREVEVIERFGHFTYQTETLALTVLTDLTERSPTFSLRPIENSVLADTVPSLVSLEIPSAHTPQEAWAKILGGRPPRALPWSDLAPQFGIKPTYGFDFSRGASQRRSFLARQPAGPTFSWELAGTEALQLRFEDYHLDLPLPEMGLLGANLCAKFLLNCQSLGVMAHLGRFEDNIMIWVRPTNGKLIERALRYIQFLLGEYSSQYAESQILSQMFQVFDELPADQSVVLETVRRLRSTQKGTAP